MALSFEEDLRAVLNRHCAEAPSGTPDYILAEFLTEVLKSFNETVGKRSEWRGESVELPALQVDPPNDFNDQVLREFGRLRAALESAGIEIPRN